MKLGFCLPQMGRAATPEAIREVARRAEELGYDSLWVQQRLLRPLQPQIPYPGSPDGSLPLQYRWVLDPFQTLTYAAAVTNRIRLGTSIIVYAYHSPADVAKRVATLDVLSGGRVVFGLGLGWNKDEFDASGAPYRNRGARQEEFIRAVTALWGDDPVEFKGRFYTMPKSEVGPKPLQRPHPPIVLASFVPAGIMRAGRLCDGWHPIAFLPFETLAQGVQTVKSAAKETGRDPNSLIFPARVNIFQVTDGPIKDGRMPFQGSLEQMKEDAKKAEEAGITELALETNFMPDVKSTADFLRYLEMLRGLTD
ncbi:MAG: TIGR03619 family F420-dependent LLM class oxidoreductase [Chloroflexi bacterium]|nr:TIGR03619 family F420-dependent LLM class oxidoreductase [Chloroflexota bacterium]